MATLTEQARTFNARVRARAVEVHPGTWILAAFLAIFWCVGWVGGMLVRGLAFTGAAIKIGWQDARALRVSRGSGR